MQNLNGPFFTTHNTKNDVQDLHLQKERSARWEDERHGQESWGGGGA